MTEKKRQSTVQPEQTQGFNSLAEDELSLIDLLKIIARKKVFILTVTSVFTLISIFYAQSITPIYRATVGFLAPQDPLSLASTVELLPNEIAKQIANNKPTPFERFLANIKSYKLKQVVFVNGGFQKKFFRETEIDTDQSALAIYNSIKIVKRNGDTYLELEGSQPKVMLEFVTALVEAAKENVNTEINDIALSLFNTRVNTKINNLSTQIENLQQAITVQKQRTKEEKANEIVRLSKALITAKQMGIKNNNFNSAIRSPRDSDRVPLWFLYGELALQNKINRLKSEEGIPNNSQLKRKKATIKRLQQEIRSLRSKKEAISNTKNLAIKERKLKRLQTADLPLLKFKIVTIGEYGYSLTNPGQFWIIVGSGIAFGLLISTIMALLIHIGKP